MSSNPKDTGSPRIDGNTPPCRHLRNRGMYVYSSGTTGAPEADESTNYWCLQTMKNYGPDDDFVAGLECRNASRSCYEPL